MIQQLTVIVETRKSINTGCTVCFHVHARFDFSIHNFDCSDIMTDAAPPPYPGNPTKGPGKVIGLGFFVIILFTDPCILDNTLDN